MNNLNKQNTLFFIFLTSLCIFTAANLIAAESKKVIQEEIPYTEYPGEIGDIARYTEGQVKEINEAYEIEKEKLQTIKREQYFEDNKEETSKNLLTQEDIIALENKRAANEKTIRTKAEYVIEFLDQREPTKKAAQASQRPAFRSSSAVSKTGIVKGIAFCEGIGAAIILDELVKENDNLMGVKVVKIHSNYVEFEKHGNQWKQYVGEAPPPSAWQQEKDNSVNNPAGINKK